MKWKCPNQKDEEWEAVCQLIISCWFSGFGCMKPTWWSRFVFCFNRMHNNVGWLWCVGLWFHGQQCSLVARQWWHTNNRVSRLKVQSLVKGWSTGICKDREESHFPGFHGNIPAPDSGIIHPSTLRHASVLFGRNDEDCRRRDTKKDWNKGKTASIQLF